MLNEESLLPVTSQFVVTSLSLNMRALRIAHLVGARFFYIPSNFGQTERNLLVIAATVYSLDVVLVDEDGKVHTIGSSLRKQLPNLRRLLIQARQPWLDMMNSRKED